MKNFSNGLNEKGFSCDNYECFMKFPNDDQVATLKKKNDMVLNLGIGGTKGTFADQTPTPTQFIRNCEEVGLFQDLQNINPFEETFKRAFEAVKAGQPVYSGKSSQPSGVDDTLHTPNIFPHITDFPNSSQENVKLKSENIPPEESSKEKELSEEAHVNNKDLSESNPSKHHRFISQQENIEIVKSLENVKSEINCTTENNVILNVPEGHIVQFLTSENTKPTCSMVVIKNRDSICTPLPLTVRDKLKKSLNEKKIGKIYQNKVPISKCPSKKLSNSSSTKFFKFSKNTSKLISKVDNSENENTNFNMNISKKQKKKNDKIHSKESRSEFLARSRAASSRCREKKKLYVLHLEKINGELSIANQNLQLINISLQKQIQDLHAELLKHKDCNVADRNTEVILTEIVGIFEEKTKKPERVLETKSPLKVENSAKFLKNDNIDNLETPQKTDVTNYVDMVADPSFFSFDVAEITLEDKMEENEIPLKECNKPPDIIVRFNNVGNDFPTKLPPDSLLSSYIEIAEENVKKIYAEHSYFLKKPIINVDKRFMNYRMFKETISNGSTIQKENFGKLASMNELEKNGAFTDITGLNQKVILEPRTPPPLILLKPFKKRTMRGKQTEKT